MSYMHIDNLYKAQDILAFKTCYALEKIHGTSAHIKWADGKLSFFSGGASHSSFVEIFDVPALTESFETKLSYEREVVIYGEAYGGKMQGMSLTYGKSLRFVAFDVKIGDWWLKVPDAAGLVESLGLEFVDFKEINTDLHSIDAERDKPSTQAVRNGILEPKIREGVVLRPPFEVTTNGGRRIMAKHKRDEFAERGRPQVDLDPTKRQLLADAEEIAKEWVTPMRLEHVIDRILAGRSAKEIFMADTPAVIKGMLEDVFREAEGEVVDTKEARKAISSLTVRLLKARMILELSEGYADLAD